MLFVEEANNLCNSTFGNNTNERKLNGGSYGERCLMKPNKTCGAIITRSTLSEIVADGKVSYPSRSVEIPEARERVWTETDTILTESEETTIPRGDAVK